MLPKSTVLFILIVGAARASNVCSRSSGCQDLICNNVIPMLNKVSQEIRDKRDNSVEQLARSIEFLANTTEKKLAALEAILLSLQARDNEERSEKEAEKLLNKFVTDWRYENQRLVINSEETLPPHYLPKDLTVQQATIECARICDSNANYYAFNLYKTDDIFVCEPLADNLCESQNQMAFTTRSNGTVWEKKRKANQDSCLAAVLQKHPDRSICNILKPGCHGTWPSCTCAKTCRNCPGAFSSSDSEQGPVNCTLWPEGETETIMPIFGHCVGSDTVLAMRIVKLTTEVEENVYVMSFANMARLSRLDDLQFLSFLFLEDWEMWYGFSYNDWSIDANGTLSNLTFHSNLGDTNGDLFNLNSQAMKPIPFVTVTDDRYGCGSFWLLDPRNATYCPGDGISMFGKFEYDGYSVQKTGISFPRNGAKTQAVASLLLLRQSFHKYLPIL